MSYSEMVRHGSNDKKLASGLNGTRALTMGNDSAALEPAWVIQRKLKQLGANLAKDPSKIFSLHEKIKEDRAVGLLSSYLDLPSSGSASGRNPFYN